MSKQHGMEMFRARDDAHVKAMNEMKQLMQKPGAMAEWFESKRKEFESAPENKQPQLRAHTPPSESTSADWIGPWSGRSTSADAGLFNIPRSTTDKASTE